MSEDDPVDEPFGNGWSVDYPVEYDPEAVEEVLSTEWKRNLLVVDYESAGEDARNKETLLIQSFYVSLVLFGLLLDVGYRLAQQEEQLALFGLSTLGVVLFGLLANWSVRYRQGRDASWDRRSEIEDFVKLADPDVLRSNDSKFKRLSRTGDGTYRVDEQPWYEAGSIATVVVYAELAIGLLWLAVAVWTGTSLL
ncbi:hypothetical protein Htur_0447 [Haloterrigena turkmenica DSM 5511]|uniref:Uncharacterized protein n=1 Tax=Haloterrigena turkmenica (strain ATCC 51198 / DSM 5511 / JCM 9101 / NCIMB 13204 / VKM B-1734 / 4k) TaxID=543526 RepID=D2RVI1_HALTV|nr:hypothetical protein [Haloterrigena turkmenica]ADB59345.1 hypothetical protein Htur_0447 [Haloterrigena turkmenica DSM 5511]